MDISTLILKNLHYCEEYTRKVLPFIKPEYFSERCEKIVFEEISAFITEYRNVPTYESLIIQINEKSLSESDYSSSMQLLNTLYESKAETVEIDWLINKTEQYCQEKAIYNAVLESISILDDKHGSLSKGSIPSLLSDALAVSFDASIGHDYLDDADSRYDYYHKKEDRIPFRLEWFNKISAGGLPKKTLTIILSPPHSGKSLMMCDFAAGNLDSGKNVLYITCEMAEPEIAKRIDANLMNITLLDIMNMSKEVYDKKIAKMKDKQVGKLVIKEYPTACASVSHFRVLLNELKLKKNFVPDIIYIDYLNICASSRVKMSGSVNSYTYVKAIGEEFRGLAQEMNVPIVSATQTTRGASTSSDPEMGDVSESFGIPAISDMLFAIVASDELKSLNQIMIKQIKNRFTDVNLNTRFCVGIDRAKMKLYDLEPSAQYDITNSNQTKDIPSRESFGTNSKSEFKKKSFEGIKV